MLTHVPAEVMVYMSTDLDVYDKFVVIYPDGAVYRMSNYPKNGICAYEGVFSKFTPSDNEILINKVPDPVAQQIKLYMP